MSSNYEGWGKVIVEAAAVEKPIIMTEVGCAGEIIKNNENGIVVPVDDQKAFANGMIKMIEDNDFRNIAGKKARQAILKLPTEPEILNRYKLSWEETIKNYKNK